MPESVHACNGNFHRLSKDMPAYMYVNHRGEVCCNPALLAEHVRENVDYILVRDNGKQGILVMVYNHGVYTLYAPDMFKAIIKYFIAEYDNSLVKMKDVDEAYRHIVTDFDYVRQSDLNFDETIINFQNTIVRVSGDQILTFGHSPQVISTIQILRCQ